MVQKIELQKLDAGDRLHLQNVERDDTAAGPGAARGDFAPAARRGAEIDHAGTGFEQMKFVVDLGELVGGTGAKAFALGAGDVRVIELARQPGARRGGALFAGLEQLCHAVPAAYASPQTRSSRIISTSMPSRRPRSATRSRGHGNARRIASRMAQPASTRSARSAPMHGLAARSSKFIAISSATTAEICSSDSQQPSTLRR